MKLKRKGFRLGASLGRVPRSARYLFRSMSSFAAAPTTVAECVTSLNAARKAKNGREVMKLMKLLGKLKKTEAEANKKESAEASATSGGAAGTGGGGGGARSGSGSGTPGSPQSVAECVAQLEVARKAKNGREVMKLMKLMGALKRAEAAKTAAAAVPPATLDAGGGPAAGAAGGGESKVHDVLPPAPSLRVQSSVMRDAGALETQARCWCESDANKEAGLVALAVHEIDMPAQVLRMTATLREGAGRQVPVLISFRDLPCSISSPDPSLERFNDAALQFCFGDKARSVSELLFFTKRFLERLPEREMRRLFADRTADAGSTDADEDGDYEEDDDDDDDDDDDYDDDYSGYYDDDDDDDPGLGDAPPTPDLVASQSYVPMGPEELAKHQVAMIQRVCASLKVNYGQAGILLRHMKWDEHGLLQRYRLDEDELCKEAGVAPVSTSFADTGMPTDLIQCQVCTKEVKRCNASAMGCNHGFCDECWGDYLERQLTDGDVRGTSVLATRCPAFKCPYIVDYTTFKKVCSQRLFKKVSQR